MNLASGVQRFQKAYDSSARFALRTSRGAVLLAGVILSGTAAVAQFDTGTIAGSVTDQAGAILPQTMVTITNTGTGTETTLPTDSSGSFVASGLP